MTFSVTYDCSICLEGPKEDNPIVPITHENNTVDHFFHSLCIQLWISKGQTVCPNCRLKITHVNGYAIQPLQKSKSEKVEAVLERLYILHYELEVVLTALIRKREERHKHYQ